MKKIGYIIGQIVLFVAIYLAFDAWQTRNLLADVPAPEFELVSTDNQLFKLSDLPAEETVIYFFAPWCKICHMSIGNLEALRQSVAKDKLNIVVIALDWKSTEEIVKYKKDHGLTMPVLLGSEKTMQDYKIQGFPTYYILDKNHNITKVSMGYSTELGLKFRT